MVTGIMAGVLWGLNTVVLGMALAMTPFVSTEQAVFLAPFVSTFLHDFFVRMDACLYGNSKTISKSYTGIKNKKREIYYAGSVAWRSYWNVRLCSGN